MTLLPWLAWVVAGSLSGIASSTVTFPLDLVRQQMQLEGVGPFKHIIPCEGLRGWYRGILPEYCIVVPGVGIVFMTYETR
ncbi:hypothetical protein ACET3Z_027790 [Daucus carota]